MAVFGAFACKYADKNRIYTDSGLRNFSGFHIKMRLCKNKSGAVLPGQKAVPAGLRKDAAPEQAVCITILFFHPGNRC